MLLRDVTGDEPLPWAVRAPHPWFCHHCDSNCHAGEIQVATIKPRRWRRPLIVCQPREWRHVLQRRDDVHWTTITHITQVLERHLPPATAIRWDPVTQRLHATEGTVIDWKDTR